MATPIKATPILTGRDSIRFAKAIENPQKISPERLAEMHKSYEWFKRAAQFYEKNDFRYLTTKDIDEDTRAMYFDLKTI